MQTQTALGSETGLVHLGFVPHRREIRWLHNRAKPVSLDSRLATFEARLRTGLVGVPEGTSWYGTPGRRRNEFCEQGHLEWALDALFRLDGVPSVDMYRSILKACGQRKALVQAKLVIGHLGRHGLEYSTVLGEYIVITLVKCGGLEDAVQVFERLRHRSVLSWTAVISGYATTRQGQKALRMYQWMQEEGVRPNVHTFVGLLKACGSMADLEVGKYIHAELYKYSCEDSLVVRTCLVDMYGKCGSTADAQIVFEKLTQRDVVAWNAMLAAYAQQGQAENAFQLYVQLREQGVSPNARTFVSMLQACGGLADSEEFDVSDLSTKGKSLANGKEIHANVRMKGFDSDVFVGSTLVCMYGKCGSIVDAQTVFEGLFHRDVVVWNSMLAAYTEQSQGEKALLLYEKMQEEGVSSNARTFVSILQACDMVAEMEEALDGRLIKLKSLVKGKVLHAHAQKNGYSSDVFVGSTLVSMYSKCGSIMDAQSVFDRLAEHDVVAWTAMLVAYVEQGQEEKALQFYEKMQEEGVRPNSWTYVTVLQACGIHGEKGDDCTLHEQSVTVKCLEKGKAIHGDAWLKGFDSHPFVGNALVTMYGRCGSVVDAWNIFVALSTRDVVSWNAMLMAYVQEGQADKALQLFQQMPEEGAHPDEITILWVLQACSKTGSLGTVRQVHEALASTGDNFSPFIASTLIIAYGRCASMLDARTVFEALPNVDVVSWNALIASYARQGDSVSSLQCYDKMQLARVHPNGVTFLSLLAACSHAGLVDKGLEYFESMSRDHGLTPETEHFVSLLDLLGRAGWFTRIDALLSTMPVKPTLSLWLCLLGACQKHGKIVLGKQAFGCAVRLQPEHPSAYVLMSNIYADAGLWEEAKEVMQLRQDAAAWKNPGQSWIEYEKEVHTFVVGDCNDAQRQELYDLLQKAVFDMEKEHVPREICWKTEGCIKQEHAPCSAHCPLQVH